MNDESITSQFLRANNECDELIVSKMRDFEDRLVKKIQNFQEKQDLEHQKEKN